MDAAKEILLYYLEALSDAAEEVAQVGRMDPATHERLGRAYSYVTSLKGSGRVGGYGFYVDPFARGFPTILPSPQPRLLHLISAPTILLASNGENKLAFHENAWRLVEEARYWMHAVDLGWVRVETAPAAPYAR